MWRQKVFFCEAEVFSKQTVDLSRGNRSKVICKVEEVQNIFAKVYFGVFLNLVSSFLQGEELTGILVNRYLFWNFGRRLFLWFWIFGRKMKRRSRVLFSEDPQLKYTEIIYEVIAFDKLLKI